MGGVLKTRRVKSEFGAERALMRAGKGREDLDGFVIWLAGTQWSIALHESLYMYSITESAHVMAIMLFVGTIMMVDLRFLGVSYRNTPVSEMTAKILPWTVGGFVVLCITGVMLFYAIPIRTWHSIWFRIKCVLLVVGMINAAWSALKVENDKETWDRGPTPRKAKIAACVSLFVWTFVIVFGRLIAYNWTDCDQNQSPFIQQIEDCKAVPADT